MTATLPNPITEACETCPLGAYWRSRGAFSPCPSEINSEADVVVVGSAPRKQDVTAGRAWTDHYGAEVVQALKKLGKSRQDVSWTNVVACRWPKDDAKSFMAGLKKRNRHRKRKGQVEHRSPMKCCEERLRKETEDIKNVIPMGILATKAVLPGNPTFTNVRGGPVVLEPHGRACHVLPTFHPEQIQFQPKYRPIFKLDLAKAFRFFEGNLDWTNPEIVWNPSPLELRSIIAGWKTQKAVVIYDVEAVKGVDEFGDELEHFDALTDDLRCIGLGTQTQVAMVHFLSVDGETRFYPEEVEQQIKQILAAFFTYPHITKCGHNAGYYDRMVVEQHFGATPTPLVDSILLHHLAESEYPHGLGYIGSVYTDVPSWKAEHTATTAETDKELGTYCAIDCAVTDRAVRPLLAKMETRQQRHLYKTSVALQDLCVGMHRLGIRIDEERRQAHEDVQVGKIDKWGGVISDFDALLNPNSHDQVRRLLFKEWALPPHQMTDSGEASTNAASLINLLSNPLVGAEQKVFISALRKYRKAQRLLSTYLMPWSMVARGSYIHADWNVTGTVGGRLSSSSPNFQNIPFILRDIFVPPPGCVFIEADFDQLELRLLAVLSGAEYYLDAFRDKAVDPHSLTAQLMFGEGVWALEGAPVNRMKKGAGSFKKVRDASKTLCFLSGYGGQAPMAHEQMVATEAPNGDLLYSHYSLREVRALQRRWLRNVPELKVWWDGCMSHWRRTGYIEEPILKRRRYMYEEDFNALPNFQAQAGGFALVARGMLKLVKEIGFDFSAKTGMVNQLHDAVLMAVPEAEAEQARDTVVGCLETRALGMNFTVDASIGTCWGEKG